MNICSTIKIVPGIEKILPQNQRSYWWHKDQTETRICLVWSLVWSLSIVEEFCELIYLGSTTDVCARWSQTKKIIPKLVSTNISSTNAQVTTEKLVLQSLQLNLKGTVSSKFRSKGLAFDGCISCGALLRTSHSLGSHQPGQHTNFSFKRDLNFSRFTKQCLVCVICD